MSDIHSSLHIATADKLSPRANPLCHYNTRWRSADIIHRVYAGPGHRNRRYHQGRGSCDFIVPEEGFLDVCGLRPWKKKGDKKAAAGEQFHRTRTCRGPDQGRSSYSRLKNRRQLPAIVRHDLASNHANKSRFCGRRSETYRSRFIVRGKLFVRKEPRDCICEMTLQFMGKKYNEGLNENELFLPSLNRICPIYDNTRA